MRITLPQFRNLVAVVLLGIEDAVEVRRQVVDEIERGEVVVDLVVQGENDPLCCPTQPVTYRFRLANDELGYIIPEYDFRSDSYEETMSQGPATAPIIRETAIRMLTGVK